MGPVRAMLAVPLVLVWLSARALAEGSSEFDIADTSGSNTNDQAVNTATVLYVDILDGNDEKICYRGNSTSLVVYRPAPAQATQVATLASGECTDAVAGIEGAYLLDIGTQTLRQEWDVRVCAKSVSDVDCLGIDANERLGRLWSYDWSFQSNLDYAQAWAINGSVYAIVPGGAADRDAVIEMQRRSVSGARYHLFANSFGPETSAGVRIGRSVAPDTDPPNKVTPEFPLYLNPPRGRPLQLGRAGDQRRAARDGLRHSRGLPSRARHAELREQPLRAIRAGVRRRQGWSLRFCQR